LTEKHEIILKNLCGN